MPQATTLYEYYTQQGKPLPPLSQRFADPAFAAAAQQAGISQAQYTGTSSQNVAILAALQAPKTEAPITSRLPGESPEDLTKRVGGGATSLATIIGTSESERIKERAKALREAFGLPEKPPEAPPALTTEEKGRLDIARTERETLEKESEEILEKRTALEEEFRKFKEGQVGLPEAGRIGAISEEGRKVQEQLDVLNRRELVVETKLRNRNNVINELMQVQRQNYTDALRQYNTNFSQAVSLYSLFDKDDDELQRNAKASLDVLSNAYKAQIEAGQLNLANITPIQRAKLEEYETQARLPLGSTMAVLETLKPKEEILYKAVDNQGNFNIITKLADGSLSYKRVAGVAVPRAGAVVGISDIRGLGLPMTALGISEAQVEKDLKNTTPPTWFNDWIQAMANMDPARKGEKVSPQEAQARWEIWRNEKLAEEPAVKRMTATTIDPAVMADLVDDIQKGASLDTLFEAYPEVSSSLIQGLYYNIPPSTTFGT